MSTLQEQIDDLRERLVELQSDILLRAPKTVTIDLNDDITDQQTTIFDTLDSLEGCIRDLQNAILQAREDLTNHTH